MVLMSERSIERIITDVASKVERLTGWDANLKNLTVKLVSRNQVWEHGMKPKYDILGIETQARTAKGKMALASVKNIMPYLILGLYEPMNGTMIIIPENVRLGTNESGIATTLGHELVHRCQFINNPEFARLYTTLVQKTTGSNAYDEDDGEDSSYLKYLQSYMTLVEGDASHVEGQLKKMFYQDAKNKISRISNFVGLALFLQSLGNTDKQSSMKMKQYIDGKKIVGGVYESTGREGVNRLYTMDMKGIHSKFG